MLRARSAAQSIEDAEFARQLQAEMDAEEEAQAAPRREPTQEQIAAAEADAEMARKLQAELYAEEQAEEEESLRRRRGGDPMSYQFGSFSRDLGDGGEGQMNAVRQMQMQVSPRSH